MGLPLLLTLVLALVVATLMAVERAWAWRPPLGRRVVVVGSLLLAGFMVYAVGSLSGAWFSVTCVEAQEEFATVLGFGVPPVARVLDAHDLGWAPTDGDHYGYTALFSPADFRRFMAGWATRTDSLQWQRVDSLESITYTFAVDPARREVRYFHADE